MLVKFTHLTLSLLLAILIFTSCGDSGAGDLEDCAANATIANQSNTAGTYLLTGATYLYQSFQANCGNGNIDTLTLRLKASSGTGSLTVTIYSEDGVSGSVSTELETETISGIVSSESRLYTVTLSNKSMLKTFKEYWIRIVPVGVDIEVSTSGATSYYSYGLLTTDPTDSVGIDEHKDMYFKIVTD